MSNDQGNVDNQAGKQGIVEPGANVSVPEACSSDSSNLLEEISMLRDALWLMLCAYSANGTVHERVDAINNAHEILVLTGRK